MCREPFFQTKCCSDDQCGRPPPPVEDGCGDPTELAGIEDPAVPALRPPPQPPAPLELPPEDPPPTRAGAGVIAGRAGAIAGRAGTELCPAVGAALGNDVVVRTGGRLPRPAVASLTLATLLRGCVTAFAATWPEFTKRCSAGSYMIDDWRTMGAPAGLVVNVLAGSTRETGAGAVVLPTFPATRAFAGRCLTTDTFSPFATATGDVMVFPPTGYTPRVIFMGVLPLLSSGCAGTNPKAPPELTQTAVTGRYVTGLPPAPPKPLGVHIQPYAGA